MTVHTAGVNHSTDRIRMAMIHDFKKIHASVSVHMSDAQLMDFENEDIWRDWSLSCFSRVLHEGSGQQWKRGLGTTQTTTLMQMRSTVCAEMLHRV